MGGLPTQKDLDERERIAHDKLKRLKEAHDVFIGEWDKIQREKQAIVRQAHDLLDKQKISHMVKVINKIK